VVRLELRRLSVLNVEIALRALVAQNAGKHIWDKDPINCRAVRGGLKVDEEELCGEQGEESRY
jgi:hypothetical protein